MVGALGFDFDHTLGIDNRLEVTVALDAVEALCARHGRAFSRDAATPVVEAAVAAYRNGALPLETALEGVYLNLAGPGDDNVEEAMHFRDLVLARAPDFVRALPGVAATFAALDELQVRYAILTNGWSPLQEQKARLIGFDGPVLVSERIGVRKPQPEAFRMLASHLDVPVESLWYVGDDPLIDCAGAAGAGAHAIWFDWEGRTYPGDLAPPALVVHGLDELAAFVQGQGNVPAKAST